MHELLEPEFRPASVCFASGACETEEDWPPQHPAVSRNDARPRTSASRWTGAPLPAPARCVAMPMPIQTIPPHLRTRIDAALSAGALKVIDTFSLRRARPCLSSDSS